MKNKYVVINHVAFYRKKCGFSQNDLAFMCGLSQNSISDIELSKNNVSIYNALKLSNALFCSVEQLFELPDEY